MKQWRPVSSFLHTSTMVSLASSYFSSFSFSLSEKFRKSRESCEEKSSKPSVLILNCTVYIIHRPLVWPCRYRYDRIVILKPLRHFFLIWTLCRITSRKMWKIRHTTGTRELNFGGKEIKIQSVKLFCTRYPMEKGLGELGHFKTLARIKYVRYRPRKTIKEQQMCSS